MATDPNTLSGRLRRARRLRDLSQEQMAARLGVTRQTVNRWENDPDAAASITVERLREIADELGTTISDLLPECSDDDEPSRRAA